MSLLLLLRLLRLLYRRGKAIHCASSGVGNGVSGGLEAQGTHIHRLFDSIDGEPAKGPREPGQELSGNVGEKLCTFGQIKENVEP